MMGAVSTHLLKMVADEKARIIKQRELEEEEETR